MRFLATSILVVEGVLQPTVFENDSIHFCPRELVEETGSLVAFVTAWLEKEGDGDPFSFRYYETEKSPRLGGSFLSQNFLGEHFVIAEVRLFEPYIPLGARSVPLGVRSVPQTI